MRDLARYGGPRFDDFTWWEGRHKVKRVHATPLGYPNDGDSGNGCFMVRMKDSVSLIFVIASNGGGWDHVSVSLVDRVPTWDEMCCVKALFFEAEECVIQYHPPASSYVNNNPYVLHMWRPQNQVIPMPDKGFV